MMAPSLETSCRGHLPIVPSTPVRVVTDLFSATHARALATTEAANETNSSPSNAHHHNPFETPVRHAVTGLHNSSASFLATSSPIHSLAQLPPNPLFTLSLRQKQYHRLLKSTPSTFLEEQLQQALRDMMQKNMMMKEQLTSMQSTLVLNGVYVDLVHKQLQAQKEKSKKKKKGRLVGDRMPRLLSARAFVSQVEEFHRETERKAAEAKKKKASRTRHSEALKEWRKLDKERVRQNEEICTQWQADKAAWKAEVKLAQEEGREPEAENPGLLRDLIFPPVPKPARDNSDGADEESSDSSDSNNSDDNNE
ncbi:hypothetical protein BDN71DRAFT_1508219 [Pleurotus eryngii]|uniref:Uncharacterized protein n=1 Tax=Pleurotus eryngii TaxID=5323 RepID=A0A9P5ZUE2_PLEER|nr:hypothetical protein BDN71DRAFT_1508219 [Pleurotus eryngii]